MPVTFGPDVGGMLYMEYAEPVAGERHSIRLHVAPFSPIPAGPSNDYTYTGVGSVVPTESGILATFAAFGALWAAYYPAAWSLSIVDVWRVVDDVLTRLDVVPIHTPVVGVSTEGEPGGVVQKRWFRLNVGHPDVQRLWFSQVPGTQTRLTVAVSPASGGIDSRDRAVMSYLSGTDTGIVARGGERYQPAAVVHASWARRLAPAPTGPLAGRDTFIGTTPPDLPQDGWLWVDTSLHGAPYQLKVYDGSLGGWVEVGLSVDVDAEAGVVGADCLVFPLGGQVCNPSVDLMTLSTPTGLHQWDPTGYTLPGGHRLEQVAG